MIDRALQALILLSFDPIVEELSDPNSFGFRKNRSPQDAVVKVRYYTDKP
jgi:RNA-directed DNA polymerase